MDESLCRHMPGVLRTLIGASLVAALGLSMAASGADAASPGQGIERWQHAIEQLRMPGKGCFDAAYPKVQWRPAKCTRPPSFPFDPPPPPHAGPPPAQVGDGMNDYVAQVSGGSITSATGSFPSESSGVTETGLTGGIGPVAPNMYTLQLNTETFTTPACKGGGPSCLGFEQFVYDTSTNTVAIQNWLNEYDAPCPSAAWTEDPLYGHIYCFIDSPGAGALTALGPTAGQLASDMVTITGSATGGGMDTMVMTDGGSAVGNNTQPDSVLNLAGHWDGAEFNIFGDGFGTEATFSAGTNLGVGLAVHLTGGTPYCADTSYTGETNNLNLQPDPVLSGGPAPSMAFGEASSAAGAACASGDGWGEIHLNTFRNLTYNFQAAGDFELATTGPASSVGPLFGVQARLVPFGPHPNLSVSRAVAAQVGPSHVAVCLGRQVRLEINGLPAQLASGHWRALAGGGTVSRQGDTYLIRDADGDSVQAEPDSYLGFSYLDVRVGLGRWPTPVQGLLASAGSDAGAVQSSGGTILTAPFQFGEFYQLYGNSWRVPAQQDLLSACGTDFASGNPTENFEVSNLPPRLQRIAQAICVRAGVKAPALLDACTLDVAVLGKEADRVYATLPANVIWGKILSPGDGS